MYDEFHSNLLQKTFMAINQKNKMEDGHRTYVQFLMYNIKRLLQSKISYSI